MTARFRYRAADMSGRVLEGDLQSPSRHAAIEELRRQKLFPVDVLEVGAVGSGRAGTQTATTELVKERLPLTVALALWTRTVATMLAAGVALERALTFSSSGASNPVLAEAIEDVRRDVNGGASLGSAMRRHPRVFGAVYIAMVSAGEEGGALEKVMSRLADHLDEVAELRAQVRSALLYPVLMAIVAGMGVTVILLFVVPRIVSMLGDIGGQLPLSTRALISMSDALVRWWVVWIPVIALSVFLINRWLSSRDNRRRFHQWRLSFPIVGELERDYSAAQFTRTLGLLLESGVGLVSALRMARSSVSNVVLGEAIERATSAVTQGKRLAPELHGAFPPLAEQLIAVGEESGQLDELCIRAADSFDRETSRRMRALIGLIEPVMILLFGLLVGFVALAMLQAIYSINAQVR